MSMPAKSYKCNACDFTALDIALWGYRFYWHNGTTFPLRSEKGWCNSCNFIRAIEKMPLPDDERKHLEAIEACEKGLNLLLLKEPTVRAWWRFKQGKSKEVSLCEGRLLKARNDLTAFRLFNDALAKRTSKPRCLHCGSEDCNSLLEVMMPHKREQDLVVVLFKHPGCGGTIVRQSNDLRISVRLRPKAYDIEGQLIESEHHPAYREL